MFPSYESIYPLGQVSRYDFAKICEVLWGWTPCDDWSAGRSCQRFPQNPYCYCQQAERLSFFFDFYKEVTTFYIPDQIGNCPAAVNTHDDLVAIIRCIKNSPDKPRVQLTTDHFRIRHPQRVQETPSSDQNRAFSLAARIITMLQCSVEGQTDGLLEAGSQPITWRSDKSFNQFIETAIPKQSQLRFGSNSYVGLGPNLPHDFITAKRLQKVARLKFIPTNDLKDHLLLNRENGTLAIYHYTSFLREHLQLPESSIKQ
jgi:hypothetical protein